MAIVGRVEQVWRYPVKSMAGEQLARAAIGARGVAGDRGWAVRDDQAAEIRGAKKLPALLQCRARYLTEPVGEIPAAEITLPDGARLRTDSPDVRVRLSALLGRPVTLWPLQPATASDHYRRGLPDDPDMIAELRSIFGRTEDEPLPDLSVFPPEIMEYTSPLGTYFDAFPLHVLTMSSLATLRHITPSARFDVRRFRPNVLIDTGTATGLIENDWCGKRIRIGSTEIHIETPCPRCVMTTLPQDDLPKDPTVLRTIVRDAAQNLGVYATVVAAGHVAAGDPVEVL